MKALAELQKAPAFKGTDQNGKTISLKDFAGKKLVVYFYPKDLTPTCTVQACNLRDNFSALTKKGIYIVGINADDMAMHLKFAGKHELPFPLIADTSHAIIEKFGVWGEKMLYGKKYMGLFRTTFLIDEKGIIQKIITKPKSKDHATEILSAWKEIDEKI